MLEIVSQTSRISNSKGKRLMREIASKGDTTNKDAFETELVRFYREVGEKNTGSMFNGDSANLSGGQLQFLTVIDALRRSREVIFMDEPTSALDKDKEKILVDLIKSEKGKITLMVVSHRRAILEICDKLYKLENGGLKEFRHEVNRKVVPS